MLSVLLIAGALALLILLIRWIYDCRWDRGLSCVLSFQSSHAVEGETAFLQEVVVNDKSLPLPVVEIGFHMDRRLQFIDGENTMVSDKTYRRDVFALGARQKTTRTLEFSCVARGYFRLEETSIAAQDLFLTRKYLIDLPQQTEFYVLPRAVPAPKVEIPYSKIMGAVLSRKKLYDDPFEFAGLREYSRSDPMKFINWKATARAGMLLTNLHESTLSQKITVLLDVETFAHPQMEQLAEDVIRLAGALCIRLLSAGVELSLVSNGSDVLSGGPWQVEKVSGGSGLFLRKRLACLLTGNGLPGICSCVPEDPREERLLVLVTGSQRFELTEEFSRLTGKETGVEVIVCERPQRFEPVPKNVDVIWTER